MKGSADTPLFRLKLLSKIIWFRYIHKADNREVIFTVVRALRVASFFRKDPRHSEYNAYISKDISANETIELLTTSDDKDLLI